MFRLGFQTAFVKKLNPVAAIAGNAACRMLQTIQTRAMTVATDATQVRTKNKSNRNPRFRKSSPVGVSAAVSGIKQESPCEQPAIQSILVPPLISPQLLSGEEYSQDHQRTSGHRSGHRSRTSSMHPRLLCYHISC